MDEKELVEAQLGVHLRRLKWSLAVAESCTGGLLGHRITNVPGASDYFLGGVVAYANSIKIQLLGVPPQKLETFGAVSEQTVKAMACGVRERFGADVSLAISGIAGPSGGTPEKPVGMVWIGMCTPSACVTRRYQFSGDREEVKGQATEAALRWLLEALLQEEKRGGKKKQ